MKNFEEIPRIEITHAPTPLELAPRLSQVLGCQLYIKRDDCTGLAGAQRSGADTLVTVGGLQSNHARQTAAAAAKFGFACELILEDVAGTPEVDYYSNGNLLLDSLLGARIHRLEAGEDGNVHAASLVEKLSAEGRKPYLIPLGGSNATGSFGYVRCALELVQQLRERNLQIDQIVLASGSAGTQAGLLAGLIVAGVDIPVLGISVSRSTEVQRDLVHKLLLQVLAALELDAGLAQARVVTNGNYFGAGYGIATPAMIDAVKRCAQLEGLLLDPVYTGKAMAGFIDLCERGSIPAGSNQLFLHSGGSPGLYAYREVF